MHVILEPLLKQENYCYQHEIQFDSVSSYKFHVEWCEKFLEVPNLCTCVNTNGLMCGEEFKHVASLIFHSFAHHGVYLCVHCKGKFGDVDALKLHEHTTKHAQESKENKISLIVKKILKIYFPFRAYTMPTLFLYL